MTQNTEATQCRHRQSPVKHALMLNWFQPWGKSSSASHRKCPTSTRRRRMERSTRRHLEVIIRCRKKLKVFPRWNFSQSYYHTVAKTKRAKSRARVALVEIFFFSLFPFLMAIKSTKTFHCRNSLEKALPPASAFLSSENFSLTRARRACNQTPSFSRKLGQNKKKRKKFTASFV